MARVFIFLIMKIVFYVFSAVVFITTIVFAQLLKNAENYGPYLVVKYDLAICSGPKQKNLTFITGEVTKKDNSFVGTVKHTFLERAVIQQLKVDVFTVNAKRKKILYRYNMKDVCKHFAAASLIKNAFKANKDCVVDKGTYDSFMNFTLLTENFLGESFFFGEFIFHAVSFSNKGNIFCFHIDTLFEKKVK